MNKKLWGGRFDQPTHASVEAYTASITFDHVLIEEDILGSLAHAQMLAASDLLTDFEAHLIQTGLQEILEEYRASKIEFSVQDEDLHMNIERLLHEKIGPIADKLHTGRSRNDQVALDMHLYVKKEIVLISSLLMELQAILLEQADLHQKTLVPGYTHLQGAQPIYLAQHWLAYVSMFERDLERLQDGWKRTNVSPLGAAALAGTTLPLNKEMTAEILGFDQVYSNTLDAVSDRDFVIELIATAAIIMMHLSRFSEELILWSTAEFGFISFSDQVTTGSSIMPQKKNPDVVELARGKTARVYGNLMSILTLFKALPLAYNKDMQEDKEPLFDTVNTLKNTLSIFCVLLNNIAFHTERMEKATQQGYLNATALAEYLVIQGLSFRAAHETVGKLVAYAIQQSKPLEDLSLTEFQALAPMLTDSVYEVIALPRSVATPDHTLALAKHRERLNNHRHWAENRKFRSNSMPPSDKMDSGWN